jgi:hypothetical protein
LREDEHPLGEVDDEQASVLLDAPGAVLAELEAAFDGS